VVNPAKGREKWRIPAPLLNYLNSKVPDYIRIFAVFNELLTNVPQPAANPGEKPFIPHNGRYFYRQICAEFHRLRRSKTP
jgi:hypothetical protein